jgi:hypothetical protein
MKGRLLEGLTVVLLLAGIGFFVECVLFLSSADYVAAVIALVIGLSVIHIGAELARLSLVKTD